MTTPDPETTRLPPWRTALAGALHRGRSAPESRYVQLATVADDGGPRNRTVVFRGFGPGSELVFFTDLRSAKCVEIARQPLTEICWYLPKTREQFRLKARLEQHGADAAGAWAGLRTRSWQERGARGQSEWLDAVPEAPVPLPVPQFILLAAVVAEVDHLQLRPTPQRRTVYRRAGEDGWLVLEQNPIAAPDRTGGVPGDTAADRGGL